MLKIKVVLRALVNNLCGLQPSRKKCRRACTKVKVLGHIASSDGISPDSERVDAVGKVPDSRDGEGSSLIFLSLVSIFDVSPMALSISLLL